MESGVKSSHAIVYERKGRIIEPLRGYGFTSRAVDRIATVSSYFPNKYNARQAREMKRRLVDYMVAGCTKKIKNTKIARIFHKHNMLKHYTEKDEYIRILI